MLASIFISVSRVLKGFSRDLATSSPNSIHRLATRGQDNLVSISVRLFELINVGLEPNLLILLLLRVI